MLSSNPFLAVAILFLTATGAVCGGLGQSADVESTIAAGVAATRQAELSLQATIEAAVAATQTAVDQFPPEPNSPPTPAQPATPVPDPEQVRAVILDEINGVIGRDLALLESLYAPNAVVIDHKGTPDDPADDTIWRGWINIERRYSAFFSAGYSALSLVELSIQLNGDQATGTHQGIVLDGTLYPDRGIYTLEKINGKWLITQLEYGNEASFPIFSTELTDSALPDQPPRDDGLYVLEVGSQHKYEEPWGWDRGDPCEAWATGNFDDTKPNYRGFNVELLLTNNSDTKVPDAWPITFTTAAGKPLEACYYGYEDSGPRPGGTRSVTFFTVVDKDDYVEKITFSLNDQTTQLCLDGKGGWRRC